MQRILLLYSVALLFCAPAAADDWRVYRCMRGAAVCQDSDGAGEITHFDLSYSFATGEAWGYLDWQVTFQNEMESVPNLVWLVLTDGVAPAQSSDRHAIVYLDLDNERAFVYEYDPALQEHSWQNATGFIDRCDDCLSAAGSHLPSGFYKGLSFGYATFPVQHWSADADWRGIAMGVEVGFSVSGVANAAVESSESGGITNFSYPAESRTDFDRAHQPTDREFAVETFPWGLIKSLYR